MVIEIDIDINRDRDLDRDTHSERHLFLHEPFLHSSYTFFTWTIPSFIPKHFYMNHSFVHASVTNRASNLTSSETSREILKSCSRSSSWQKFPPRHWIQKGKREEGEGAWEKMRNASSNSTGILFFGNSKI